MKFKTPLVPATLVSRYKRFLFDAVLDDGTKITGSCPNTGSMWGLTTPGSRIWLSEHDSPTRKYRHCLELIEADGTIVGINKGLPNRLAEEAIGAGLISNLGDYAQLKREQKYGQASRIDILLEDPQLGRAYVEVKNVHMTRVQGLFEFPDSVTTRGAKHLDELGDVIEAGHRAVMLFLVQRSDGSRLKLCRDLDPYYAAAFDRAVGRGVEAFAVRCDITSEEIRPVDLIVIDEPGMMVREDRLLKTGHP
jgi:sugar fermentation stimulation protein A